MKVSTAIAEILKREGVDVLFGYPRNAVLEQAAALGIRTVIVRQEKDHDKYLVDESETHDRPLAAVEVDAAIADYINSVKARALKK